MTEQITPAEHERRFRPGADAGDPKAMTGLAWALDKQGQAAEAELWYARAADAGEPGAMTGLGYLLHRKGEPDQAHDWWRRAAAAGDVQAMRNLASTLRGKDPAEAERWGWFAAAAERDVTGETVPDDFAEAADGFGELRSVIGRETPGSNVGCVVAGVGVGAVVAAVGIAMIAAGAGGGWGVGLLVAGAALALLTVVLLAVTRDDVSTRVWRFEHGLVHRDVKGRLDAMRWTDIRVLRAITRNYRDGRYTGTSFHYTLQHRDGHKLGLSHLLFPPGEVCVLGEAIEREVTAVRLPRALAALQEGQRLEFGDLALDADGISDGGSHLPWREVEAVDTVDGKVRVKRAGAWLNWSKTPVSAIPDVMVLLVLADALRRTAGGAR